jgi:aspartyl-tRNA(Asn)/glutamyl-tRNA(Gln) amidotransferase subunit B
VIHDARAAGNFARELQLLLRTLQVSDANMEKGEMRVEANISVSKTSVLGTKVEVKNLNSFKSVESAIDYEVRRQIELLEKDEKVLQETRGWDENRGKTFSQRVKETSDDYRYFPDPDLPSLDISLIPEFSLSRITEELPVTPARKRELYGNIGLAREQIEVIISDLSVDRFFNEVLDFTKPNDTDFIKLAANYITTDILSLCSSQSGSFLFSAADPSSFASLMRMLAEQRITSRVAKDLLPEVLFEGKNPETIASERGLLQQNTKETLLPVVRALLSENQSVVGEYKSGKESVLQFLVGQGMKATKGSANPALLAELIRQEISSNQT